MNFGIVISYIIAAFLTITIITITYTVGFSNQEVTTTLMKKNHSQAVQQILTNDIPKIGYQHKNTLSTKFIKAEKHELSFYSNIDNDSLNTIETITWKFQPDKTPDHAQNPSTRTFTRTVDGDVTQMNVGVTNFEFRYYDSYGDSIPMPFPISNYDDIVQIEVEMELQSDFTLNYRASDDDNYVTTHWKKRFSPVNLRQN